MGCNWSYCPRCDDTEENYIWERPQPIITNEQNSEPVDVITQNGSAGIQDSIEETDINELFFKWTLYYQEHYEKQDTNSIPTEPDQQQPWNIQNRNAISTQTESQEPWSIKNRKAISTQTDHLEPWSIKNRKVISTQTDHLEPRSIKNRKTISTQTDHQEPWKIQNINAISTHQEQHANFHSSRIQNKNAIYSQTYKRKPRYKQQLTAAPDKIEWMLRNKILKLIRNEHTLKPQILIPEFQEDMKTKINSTLCKERTVLLNPKSFEFKRIRYLFKNTTKGKNFQVISVKRVENLELYAMYLLKKQEIQSRFGIVEERLLFHGTKRKNVDDICENNFNWRLFGKSKGNIYGKGISFSEIAFYSSHYCEPEQTLLHSMFLVNVLQSRACIGKPCMALPVDGCDTSYKPSIGGDKDEVVVKFEDHEFYPMYIIEFFKDNCNNEVADK